MRTICACGVCGQGLRVPVLLSIAVLASTIIPADFSAVWPCFASARRFPPESGTRARPLPSPLLPRPFSLAALDLVAVRLNEQHYQPGLNERQYQPGGVASNRRALPRRRFSCSKRRQTCGRCSANTALLNPQSPIPSQIPNLKSQISNPPSSIPAPTP
jgi:hypothetical protein